MLAASDLLMTEKFFYIKPDFTNVIIYPHPALIFLLSLLPTFYVQFIPLQKAVELSNLVMYLKL